MRALQYYIQLHQCTMEDPEEEEHGSLVGWSEPIKSIIKSRLAVKGRGGGSARGGAWPVLPLIGK